MEKKIKQQNNNNNKNFQKKPTKPRELGNEAKFWGSDYIKTKQAEQKHKADKLPNPGF